MGGIWREMFDEVYVKPGASEAVLADFTASLARPLSSDEISTINGAQRNPFPKYDPLYFTWRPYSAAT